MLPNPKHSSDEPVILKNHLLSHYSYLFDPQTISIKRNKHHGWDAKSFIVSDNSSHFFVKFWVSGNLNHTHIKRIVFSYNILMDVHETMPKEMKCRVPKVILNSKKEPVTVVSEDSAICVLEMVDGVVLGKEFTSEMIEIQRFFSWLYKDTGKILDSFRKRTQGSIEEVSVDLSSDRDLDELQRRTFRCKELFEKNVDDYEMVKNYQERILDFIDYFSILREFCSKGIDSHLCIAHTDFMGFNMMKVNNSDLFYIIDWDFLAITHFEFDLTYYVDYRHCDISKNPLEEYRKITDRSSPEMKFSSSMLAGSFYFRVIDELEMVLLRLIGDKTRDN